MDDLISRKALLDAYDKAHQGPPGGARKLIEEAPDALVMCKDCKNACVYCEESVICSHVDNHGSDVHPADWYCADGERI